MTEFLDLADGTRLAFDVRGAGAAVLLVHGIGSTRATWQSLSAELAGAGYRVLSFDLRGFGQSETPLREYGMDAFVADLEAVADAFEPGRFHLIGHSLGAMMAQRYATTRPERIRSLVLASTTSHNGRRATAFARLMVQFAEVGFDAVMERPELRAQAEATLAEAFPAGVELAMLQRGLGGVSQAHANAWRACIGFSTKDAIRRLRCPVLVTHGTADLLIPFRAGERVAQAIAGAQWVVQAGAGHSLPRKQAAAFNPVVLDFLSRVSAP